MSQSKSYTHLNALLAKSEFKDEELASFLRDDVIFSSHPLDQKHNIKGQLFVKKAEGRRPQWSTFTDNIVGKKLKELRNQSSSAILLIQVEENIFAFTFGYGKAMLKSARFVSDFGLKTALNSLEAESLRSIDTHSLEEQPIQKKIQSAKGSNANVFGIDISKDILRSVTGSPRQGVKFKNISGADTTYSFSHQMKISELPQIAEALLCLYQKDLYKSSFSWVDNIKKINDSEIINNLDNKLLTAIKNKDKNILLTVPEIIDWDEVTGFSFTRSKSKISSELKTQNYLTSINKDRLTIQSIKNDRLHVHLCNSSEKLSSYSIYKSIYFEIESTNTQTTHILFTGTWYEIDKDYIKSMNDTLAQIELSDIAFPDVKTWQDNGKEKLEKEENYNERAAELLGFHLLDRKLIKINTQTTPIELCDLLSPKHELIHVKHGKAGSSGLSHLFAQGNISANLIKRDKNFREEAREKLKSVAPNAVNLIPLDNINDIKYEVIFLILGREHNTIKDNLPFFSKVNLTKTYEDLMQYGYALKIAGTAKSPSEVPIVP